MTKKKLKIAIFHLAFFYSGGGEKLVLEEMKGLMKRGHRVVCFVPVLEKQSCYPDLIDQYEIRTFFPKWPRVLQRQASLKIFLTCLFFPLIARKFKSYDVILGAGQPGFWFGWWVKKLTAVPYVIYANQPTRVLYPRQVDKVTGIWMQKQSRLPLVLNFLKPLVNWADKVSIKGGEEMLANGAYISRVLKKIYHRDNLICPSGAYPVKQLSADRWQGKVKANGFKISKPYILITNRHFPQKKFEYAINALPLILKANRSVKLVITGNRTEYTKSLNRLVRERQLTDKVLFTGLVKEQDLQRLYRQAAVYLYTSPEEDFGMGVIEAQAAGVPVIAWKSGGPATTVVDGQTGCLVKLYNQEEFTKKTIELIKNKTKNRIMGQKAREHIKRNFVWKRHWDILETALQKAAK